MKKSVIIGIIVVIILGVGGYFVFHKSPAKQTTNSTPTSSSGAPTNSASQSAASTGVVIQTKTASNVGQYLADGNNKALYTYSGDTSGVSKCLGACLYNWPPYTAASSASLPANVTVIKRSDDNSSQYAYKGMPLYYFSSDGAGEVTGDGVSNFHVAKP